MRQGVLIVISGPSGTGKGTVCKELLQQQPQLKYSVSATTRAPRTGETNGVEYFFVDKQEFQTLLAADGMLEHAEVYGNYYGTPRQAVEDSLRNGNDILLEIDIQGALQVKEKFPAALLIFIAPPSLAELSRRINKRGTDSPEVVEERMACAREELAFIPRYDYVIVNETVEETVNAIKTVIQAERYNIKRNNHLLNNLLNEKEE